MQDLTPRQRQILDFITRRIDDQGYPPTIREIGEEMGIRSTNGVNDHLKALERKGFLRREGLKSRALRPVDMAVNWDGAAGEAAAPAVTRSDPLVSAVIPDGGDPVEVKVLGRVAAGSPILADENPEATVFVDRFFLGRAPVDGVYALRVSGDSMIEGGILDGDYIFVRKTIDAKRGDVVVAMIDGEATVKRYEPDGSIIRFVPENSSMEPIEVRREDFRDTSILGVVVGVYRKMTP
ncbi:MAG TPA: transcriptional repressor LexA [Myxococcales bacterium LLY-WYZ-16_1]|nr:transcriptional repressor LexA [Myxococcales bacterium LLY-WYZ-16_1]